MENSNFIMGDEATKAQLEAIKKEMEGTQYKHRNGVIYTVLFLTNTEGEPSRLKDHPVDVVYEGPNGKKWSRKLTDWDRSFKKI